MTPVEVGIGFSITAAVVEGFAQTFLKKSVLVPALRSFWIAAAIGLFAAEAVAYTAALRLLELSTAFPLSGLSFVMVALLAHWLLGEAMTRMRWIGVSMIVVGCTLIAAEA